MGLFSKKVEVSPEEKERRQREVAAKHAELRAEFRKDDKVERGAARRERFPVDGALMVCHAGAFQQQCLVVREGQVEYYTKETGSMHRNSGVKQAWIARADEITSAVCDPAPPDDYMRAITSYGKLTVVTRNGSATIKGRALQLDYCAELITTMKAGAASSVGAAPAEPASVASPREALKELAGLFEDGLITEQEYQAKRAEVLGRM